LYGISKRFEGLFIAIKTNLSPEDSLNLLDRLDEEWWLYIADNISNILEIMVKQTELLSPEQRHPSKAVFPWREEVYPNITVISQEILKMEKYLENCHLFHQSGRKTYIKL